jgi:glycine/D-amino acid oxidase-like deaminating enzyme
MSEKKASVAIIGKGFMGLAIAYWLQKRQIKADVYSSSHYFTSSSIATGLLHLFHGSEARIPLQGRLALSKSLELMNSLPSTAFIKTTQILRPAKNAKQISIFRKRARQFPDELSFGIQAHSNLNLEQTLLVKSAWIIHSKYYLDCLENYLLNLDYSFINQPVIDLKELDHYNTIFLCCGAHLFKLDDELEKLMTGYHLTKGQLAHMSSTCLNPSFLDTALNARSYLVPLVSHPLEKRDQNDLGERVIIAGASFEREFSWQDPGPQPNDLRDRMLQEAYELWPSLHEYKNIHWKAGFRLSGPNHLPFIAHKNNRLIAVGGLGSKGLLYHSWLACQAVTLSQSFEKLELSDYSIWRQLPIF